MKDQAERERLIKVWMDQGATRRQAEAAYEGLQASQDQPVVIGRDGKAKPKPTGPSIMDE